MPTHESDSIVGFDLDGVIIDHTQNKIRIASRYGITLRPEETHAEVMAQHFTPEIYQEIKAQLYNSTPEALDAPLMEGAYDTLARLREDGVPYFLVSMQKNPMHASHLLLERGLWGNVFTPENTFFAKNKEEKHEIARGLGVTHFIDDEPSVLACMTTIPNRILFDARSLFPDTKGVLRVKNWSEVSTILRIATT